MGQGYDVFGDEEIIGDDDGEELLFGDDDDDGDFFGDDGDDPDVAALLSGADEIIGAAPAGLAQLMRRGGAFNGVGARVAKALQRAKGIKKARRVAALARKKNMLTALRPREAQATGEIPLGFSESIAAGATGTVTLSPAVLFRPKRLMIPRTIATNFTLDSLLIGQRSHLLNGNAIPCEAFQEESFNQGWRLPTIQIAQPMRMTFTNQSGATITLRGVWHGVYVD